MLAFCIPISFSESRGVSFSTARGLSKSIHGYGQSPRTDRGPAVSNQVNVDTAVKSVLNLHRENVPRLFSKSFGNCGFKEYFFHMCVSVTSLLFSFVHRDDGLYDDALISVSGGFLGDDK